MPKTTELPEKTRKLIVDLHKSGSGYRKISSMLNMTISTIGDTIRRFKSYQSTASLPRSGRPSKISIRAANHIVRKVKMNSRVTRSELQKDLEAAGTKVCKNTIRTVLRSEGFRSRKPRKTPLLKPVHV